MKVLYSNGKNLDGTLKMYKYNACVQDARSELCGKIEQIRREVFNYYPTACTELKVAEILSSFRYEKALLTMMEFLRFENIRTVHSISIQGFLEKGKVEITHKMLIKESVDIQAKIVGSTDTVLDADNIEIHVYQTRKSEHFKAKIPIRCYTIEIHNQSTVTYLNPYVEVSEEHSEDS